LKTIAALVLLAAACENQVQPCFTPPSVVKDVRILAVGADPPEARYDPITLSADPVDLHALIVAPKAELQLVPVTWELCAPSEDFPGCPPGSAVASDPEWTPGKSLRVQVSPQLIQEAIAADPLRGLRDVRVRAVIQVVGARPASASGLLFFSSRPGPLNRAPVIAGLRSAQVGQPLQDVPPPVFEIDMTVAKMNAVRPVLQAGALEEYDSLDLQGKPVHLRERVTYSFFSSDSMALGRGLELVAGQLPTVAYRGLDDFEADEPDPGTPENGQGLFNAVVVSSGNSRGVFWIVARDSRGGISWVTVVYQGIEEREQCKCPPPRRNCAELLYGCQ